MLSGGAVDDLVNLFESQLDAQLEENAAVCILKWLASFENGSEAQEDRLLRFLQVLDDVVSESGGDGDVIDINLVHTALESLAAADEPQGDGETRVAGDASEAEETGDSLVQGQSLPSWLEFSQQSGIPESQPSQASESQGGDGLREQLRVFAQELNRQTLLVDVSHFAGDKGRSLPYFDLSNQRWTTRAHKPSLIAGVDAQATMFAQRFYLVLERVKLLPNVKWWTRIRDPAALCKEDDIVLRSVEQARGLSGMQYIIGILRTNEELDMTDGSSNWVWLIEDSSTVVKLDLDQYERSDEFILNGNVVIVYGKLVGEVIQVRKVFLPWSDHPHSEPCNLAAYLKAQRSASEQTLMDRMEEALKHLAETEPESQKQPWIFLNEVYLDDSDVMNRLRNLLAKIESEGVQGAVSGNPVGASQTAPLYPKGIVLMGNFSKALSPSLGDMSRTEHFLLPSYSCWTIKRYPNIEHYARVWSSLFEVLKGVPKLVASGCHICIVPGPFDPGLPIVPRPPLAPELTSYLSHELRDACANSNVSLMGNPCRITQCHRSFLVLRSNLLPLLIDKSHALDLPSCVTSSVSPSVPLLRKAVSKLILSQSHVYPIPSSFPSREIAIMTEFDAFLWLSPCPQMVLIGDATSPSWVNRVTGRNLQRHWILSLGTFGGQKGSWAVFDFAQNTADIHSSVEFS